MILHKLIYDAAAGTYLPFALSRLRALARIYKSSGFFQEKFYVDGYRIEIQQSPPFQYIRITPAGFYFEFDTSAWPIQTWTATQDGVASFQAYNGCVIGVDVGTSGGELSANPSVRGNKRTHTGADVSKIGRQFQVQLINEPVQYLPPSAGKYNNTIFESWAPGNPHTGIALRCTEMAQYSGELSFTNSASQFLTRDAGYDVPFAKNTGSLPVVEAFLQHSTDWPRASAIQTVTDPIYGTRSFAVYIDAFSQFSVFALDAIGTSPQTFPEDQNVDEDDVRMVKPDLPIWAYQPTDKVRDYYASDPTTFFSQGVIDFPEIDWKPNHLGTKYVALIYARSPFTFDAAYWATNLGTSPTPLTSPMFDQIAAKCGMQWRWGPSSGAGTSSVNPQRYFAAPGVVEVTLDISLIGNGVSDFVVTPTVRVVRDPNTADYCSLAVGYVWYDIKGVAAKGDLVTMDVERWIAKTGSLFALSDISVPDLFGKNQLGAQIFAMKNLDTGVDLASFSYANQVVALDLSTLSAAFMMFPLTNLPGDNETNTFGVAVHVKTKFKELLTPTIATDAQKAEMTLVATTSGRNYVNYLVAQEPRIQLVSMNPPDGNGWATGSRLTQYREQFARATARYSFYANPSDPIRPGYAFYDIYKHSTPPVMDGTLEADVQEDIVRWQTEPETGGDGIQAFYCDNPRWGWQKYQSLINQTFGVCPETTFFVHPNGTWCLWTNSYISRGTGFISFTPGGYAALDQTKIEHVVLDRIHFEMSGTSSVLDTTFFDLYNKAVQKGLDAHVFSTDDNIQLMTQPVLRAEFAKNLLSFTDTRGNSTNFLELQALWDGVIYYLPDPLVKDSWIYTSGGAFPETPQGGASYGANFSQPWYNATNYGGSGYALPATSAPHVRFANPIVIGG